MGTDQNGDESGKRMVSGGNALLWRFGICAGEDTRIKQTDREIADWLLVIKISPDTG